MEAYWPKGWFKRKLFKRFHYLWFSASVGILGTESLPLWGLTCIFKIFFSKGEVWAWLPKHTYVLLYSVQRSWGAKDCKVLGWGFTLWTDLVRSLLKMQKHLNMCLSHDACTWHSCWHPLGAFLQPLTLAGQRRHREQNPCPQTSPSPPLHTGGPKIEAMGSPDLKVTPSSNIGRSSIKIAMSGMSFPNKLKVQPIQGQGWFVMYRDVFRFSGSIITLLEFLYPWWEVSQTQQYFIQL